ncbi:unnamed protein product, partial [Polarella glacialis]
RTSCMVVGAKSPYTSNMEASVGNALWSSSNSMYLSRERSSSPDKDGDRLFAAFAAEADTCDAEVSRIAPAMTPSTGASTPTPPGHGFGFNGTRRPKSTAAV